MKLPLMLSLPFVLFGFELNFSKEFNKDVTPNELASQIKVVVENKEERDVISTLNVYNKFFKNRNEIDKSNVSISIVPKYSYKDGKSELEGYSGSLNYTINSKNSDEVKTFLDKFYSQKKEEGTSFLVPNLRWKVNQEKYDKTIEELNLEALKWSEKYSSYISGEISKKCSIKKISLNDNSARPYYGNIESKTLQSSAMDMPITEKVEQNISLNANIVLECK